MFSVKSISINSFNIGDEMQYQGSSKQYFGDIQSTIVRLPEYKMYTDGQDLIFDHHDNDIVSLLQGKAFTNRLKVGNWNMFTNDDVLTIEHELAHSRVSTNDIEVEYNDMYMSDIIVVPSEKINVRLVKLVVDAIEEENAIFAQETLQTFDSRIYDSHVDGKILTIALTFDSKVFYMPKKILSAHFLNRNMKILECKCIDVDGFELPIEVKIPIFSDKIIHITADNDNIYTDSDAGKNPLLTMNFDTRYILKGSGISMMDISYANERYITEKGIIQKDDFFRKPSKFKYIMIHPDENASYTHRKSKRGNEIQIS
tara:strand:+ start:11306 stop:12247 length:942 start_codon:yes stop_codon:yes gene_type:complete